MRECDIVIPFIDGIENMQPCLDDVLEHTDSNDSRLIIVVNKSVEKECLEKLKRCGEKVSRKILLCTCEENAYFNEAANVGIKYSDIDVLIMDPHTKVSEGWIKKIKKCAYSDERIATVAPLLNYDLACTREDCDEKGISFEKIANVIEKESLKIYPKVLLLSNRCLYVKRFVLNRVGYFDEERTDDNYGSACEFSLRCLKYGYCNAICDDALVWCDWGMMLQEESRLNESDFLAKKFSKIMAILKDKRWNGQMDIVRNNIRLALSKEQNRANVLIVAHDIKSIIGGTTLHIMDVISSLNRKYNFHVLVPEKNVYKVYTFLDNCKFVSGVYERPVGITDIGFYSRDYKNLINLIIRDYGISLVHIHHMIRHYFDIKDVCLEKGIAYLVSLHDYYLIDPEVGRIDDKIGLDDSELIDLNSWRKECKSLLVNASEVIAPSEFVRSQFNRVYSLKKINVVEHGVDIKRQQKKRKKSESFNVGFLGAVVAHKGSAILKELTDVAPDGIKFHLFGTTDVDLNEAKNFVNHGKYKRDDLAQLTKDHDIDLFCVFSLWPETYCYTVTEAIACGIPVLTFDLGAPAERVVRFNLGWVLDHKVPSTEVLKKIREIMNDKAQYEDKIRSIQKYRIKNVAEMAEDYDNIYSKYVVKKKIKNDSIVKRMIQFQVVWDYIDDGGFIKDKDRLEKEIILSNNHIKNITAERDYYREKAERLSNILQKCWIMRLRQKVRNKISKIPK